MSRQSTVDSNVPASSGSTISEQSEPQVDLQLPPMSPNGRFEIIEGAFEQPRSRAATERYALANRAAKKSVSEISSRSPRLPPRFPANRHGGLFSHRTNPQYEPASNVQYSPDQHVSANDQLRILAADAETMGPVVAPIPQRLNADGSRTPLTDFGAWDVHRSSETNRSTRTATLTQGDQQPMRSPSSRRPVQSPRAQYPYETQLTPP
ncbi:MAG: hypothetical protein ACK58L_11590, partial [Planctomycetota bacterium]